MKKKFFKILTGTMAALTIGVAATSCGNSSDSSSTTENGSGSNSSTPHRTYDNETTPVTFSVQDVDGVFNPFYYTSGNDASIIGMTQISMFTTDKDAQIAFGADQPVAVLDYEQVANTADNTTTYTFVLKNPEHNVRFSNGSYLTLRDVLFNMYEYLDPAYTGSSTMYSTDIVGLNAYRTQQDSQEAQDAFEEKFAREADERISDLVTVLAEIEREHSSIALSQEQYRNYLQEKETTYANSSDMKYASKFVEDFDYVATTFRAELNTDFTNNLNTYESNGLKNDVESFLYAEGLITIDLDKDVDDPERIDYVLGEEETAALSKEQAIELVFDYYFPDQFATIVTGWASAETIRTQFTAEAKSDYFSNIEGDRKYRSISGIKVITSETTVNGNTYPYARYSDRGVKVEGSENGYEMFSITINGVDPKAIWNFSFSVAPMYYYSSTEEIAKFDYEENFGVTYSSPDFQNRVIKDSTKIGVPVGAGAYMATTELSEPDKVNAASFFDDNVAYFERNPYFLMGPAKIKLIRYKVVSANQLLNALYQGEVTYCEPSAKQEVISDLNSKEDQGFTYSQAATLGYGYIGLNAREIPSVYARRAIMASMNTRLTLNYYPGTAEIIHRPMSKVSWAYPKTDGLTDYYPFDPTGETSKNYLAQAGYTQNSKGIMVDSSGKQFTYTFTISGDSLDHPSYQTMLQSSQILNRLGCNINVTNDNNALKKLSTGDLACWAAAWSTTIDPDMYQTYHYRSNASSTLNWGYKAILNDNTGKYAYEKDIIINELSVKIEEARETLDQDVRSAIYAECLDLVMDLAVELPTYQRDDLFAYNSNILDVSTMTPKDEISPYNGPINQIWNLSVVTK